MTLTYYKSESSVSPELTEFGKKTVYIRKNIEEKTGVDEMTGETETYYEYDEAKLTFAEYDEYMTELRLDDVEDVLAEIIGGGIV